MSEDGRQGKSEEELAVRSKGSFSAPFNLRLASRPSKHRIRGYVGRRGNLHQNGLTCGCDFDSALLESSLHAAIEFALHWPAAPVVAPNLPDDRRHPTLHPSAAP